MAGWRCGISRSIFSSDSCLYIQYCTRSTTQKQRYLTPLLIDYIGIFIRTLYHASLQIVRKSSFAAAPWKNGGGITYEAIRVPAGGESFVGA